MEMTKTKKIAVLTAIATGIYLLFDAYMVALAIYFPLKWEIPLMYVGMVAINTVGLLAYDFFDEDLLHLDEAREWIQKKDGKRETVKKILSETKWLAFIVFSIWPCTLSAYLYVRPGKESLAKAATLIALGSIPCTFVWGGGLKIFCIYWRYSVPAAVLFAFCYWLLKKRKAILSLH